MCTTRNYVLVAVEKYWPEFSEGEYKDVAIFSKKAKTILLDHMRKRGAMDWEINKVIDEYELFDKICDYIINQKD